MARTCLLWTLVVACALFAVASLRHRVGLERTVRDIDVVVDHTSLLDMCQSEGLAARDALGKLKAAGVTAVAFSEATLDRLTSSGQVAAYSGAELTHALHGGLDVGLPAAELKRTPPDPTRTYLLVYDGQLLADLMRYLNVFLGPNRCTVWPRTASKAKPSMDHPEILEIVTGQRQLASAGLGFPRSDTQAAQQVGLGIWLRPQNRGRFQEQDVTAFFGAMDTLKPMGLRGFIFEGVNNDIVGYPDLLNATVQAIRNQGLLYGDVEAPTVDAAQKGSTTLGKELDDLTVRVLSIPALQQLKMTPDDMVDRLRLGARERNMRVLYLRLFTTAEAGKSLLQTNLDYVTALRNTLTASHFRLDGAKPFANISPGPISMFGMALGTAAAGLIFLELFFAVPGWLAKLILIGTPLLAATATLAHHANPAITGLALAAAIVFSVLGLAYALPMLLRESVTSETAWGAMTGAILPLLIVTAISLLGGLYMAGFMSSTTFMLSVSQFRAIKLIMVAGPIIVVLLYLTRYAPDRRSLTELVNKRLVLWHIVAFAVLAAVGLYFIERTGNASAAAASDFERYLRDLMENWLPVRPRFKEFALGHPAWIVMAVLLYKQRAQSWMWLFVLAVAIGQADVLDTFAHAHTPYTYSLLHVLVGLALGIPCGLVVGAIVARTVRKGISTEAPGSTLREVATPPLRLN